jgi:hypothetical protein
MNKLLIEKYKLLLELNNNFVEKPEYIVNPKSDKEWGMLPEDSRGLINSKSGDLYLSTSSNKIHGNIYMDLKRSGVIDIYSDCYDCYDLYGTIDNFIFVIQYGDEKTFYISESYSYDAINDNIDDINNILDLAKRKNPTVEFNNESIKTIRETDEELF